MNNLLFLLALLFDPLKPSGGPFLDLFSAGGSHRLCFDEAFADLLLVLGGGSAAFDHDGVGGVAVVIPLIGPGGLVIVSFVSVHCLNVKKLMKP
ncbi:unnamed protein product [Prunus brigantina]